MQSFDLHGKVYFPDPNPVHEILVVPEEPLVVHRPTSPIPNGHHADREVLAGRSENGPDHGMPLLLLATGPSFLGVLSTKSRGSLLLRRVSS